MKLSQLSLADYNQLDSIPVINQDLSATDFTPVANTYYRHTGATTDTFTQGVIYLYDTAYHKLGESGGGTTLNEYTFDVPVESLTQANVERFIHILCGAKKITSIGLVRNKSWTYLVNTYTNGTPTSTSSMNATLKDTTVLFSGGFRYTIVTLATNTSPTYTFREGLFADGSFSLSDITDATLLQIVYLNDVEITA